MGPVYSACHAANLWGVRPSDVGLCDPADDVIFMVAYARARSHIEIVNAWEREREAETQRRELERTRNKGRKGRSWLKR